MAESSVPPDTRCVLASTLEVFKSIEGAAEPSPPPYAPSATAPASAPAEKPLETPLATEQEPDIRIQSEKHKTVLYLAYGSNLSASTFLGRRQIRPLSQTNVVAPTLRLTFDLPGLPYLEPCFANSGYRSGHVPDHHDDVEAGRIVPADAEKERLLSTTLDTLEQSTGTGRDYHKLNWHKGLVGVAYELTASDYAHVIATEGGGTSYKDVTVPCYALDPNPNLPVPEIPQGKPLYVHTLLAPPGRGTARRPRHTSPTITTTTTADHESDEQVNAYAQASARYLNLLTTGAAEHALPHEYQTFLGQIRPYTATSMRQRLGKAMMMATWGPFILSLFALEKTLQDKRGRSPAWFARIKVVVFSTLWRVYDGVYVRVFGDGERTEGQ